MAETAVVLAHSALVSAYGIPLRDEAHRKLLADWLVRRNDAADTRRCSARG